MRRKKRFLAVIAAIVLSFASCLSACAAERDGDKNETDENIPVTLSITGLPKNGVFVMDDKNDTLRLKCLPDPDTKKNREIPLVWSVSDESVATIDSGGVMKAARAGRIEIGAENKERSIKASAELIIADERTKENENSIRITGGAYRAKIVGDEFYVAFENPQNFETEVFSDNQSVAKIGEAGKITCVGAGIALITVSAKENAETFCSLVLSVSASPHEYFAYEDFETPSQGISDMFDFVVVRSNGKMEMKRATDGESGNAYLEVSQIVKNSGWNVWGISAGGLTAGESYVFSVTIRILEGSYALFAYPLNGFTAENRGNPANKGFVKKGENEYVYIYEFVADAKNYQFLFDSGNDGDKTFKIGIDNVTLTKSETTQGDCFDE